jgi:hypothetical protein
MAARLGHLGLCHGRPVCDGAQRVGPIGGDRQVRQDPEGNSSTAPPIARDCHHNDRADEGAGRDHAEQEGRGDAIHCSVAGDERIARHEGHPDGSGDAASDVGEDLHDRAPSCAM